jgi:hypothetical protein
LGKAGLRLVAVKTVLALIFEENPSVIRFCGFEQPQP